MDCLGQGQLLWLICYFLLGQGLGRLKPWWRCLLVFLWVGRLPWLFLTLACQFGPSILRAARRRDWARSARYTLSVCNLIRWIRHGFQFSLCHKLWFDLLHQIPGFEKALIFKDLRRTRADSFRKCETFAYLRLAMPLHDALEVVRPLLVCQCQLICCHWLIFDTWRLETVLCAIHGRLLFWWWFRAHHRRVWHRRPPACNLLIDIVASF